MKKRIFGMVLALVLVLGLVPVTAWATEAEEYTVKVVPGAHIEVDSDSVDKLTQTVSVGSYFDNVYFHTESGYYFPEDYTATLNGLKITRMNSMQAFVTGIPTGNTKFVLPDAVEGLRGTATVSGKGVVGQTLTVKLTDSNAEGALSYQWMYDNGATAKYIQGATGSSYTLTKAIWASGSLWRSRTPPIPVRYTAPTSAPSRRRATARMIARMIARTTISRRPSGRITPPDPATGRAIPA